MTTTTTTRKLTTVRYIDGGDVCAECCSAVERIIRDGQRVGLRRARRADAAVGQCEWKCDPYQSHRYGAGGDMTAEEAFSMPGGRAVIRIVEEELVAAR